MRVASFLVMTAAAAAIGCDDSGAVTGVVSDAQGAPVSAARVSLGDLSTTTDASGAFSFASVPAGDATVAVTADWFLGEEKSTTIAAGDTAEVEFTLQPRPLRVLAPDADLARAYNATFDWTKATVSISHVPRPSPAEFERALYHHNPALYVDPSQEPVVTPSPLPTLASPSTFDFAVQTGSSQQQAFDSATVVDTIAETPLTAGEVEHAFLWQPGVDFLLTWDFDQASPLYAVGLAVRQQKWGAASTLAPQEIERGFLHNGEVWVQVVFQSFVTLGQDVTDSDGDGKREVYARVAAAHFSAALHKELKERYIEPQLSTLQLRDLLRENLNALYSTSNPELVSAAGIPYSHSELGTVQYPFAVIKHAGPGIVNVFLVEP